MSGDSVKVSRIPNCDLCSRQPAAVDGKTKLGGIWANMCETCFPVYGIGLGPGLGQRLILAKQE